MARAFPALHRIAADLDQEPREHVRVAGVPPFARETCLVESAAARMPGPSPYPRPDGVIVLLHFRGRIVAVLFVPGLRQCIFEERGQAGPAACRHAGDAEYAGAVSADHFFRLAVGPRGSQAGVAGWLAARLSGHLPGVQGIDALRQSHTGALQPRGSGGTAWRVLLL